MTTIDSFDINADSIDNNVRTVPDTSESWGPRCPSPNTVDVKSRTVCTNDQKLTVRIELELVQVTAKVEARKEHSRRVEKSRQNRLLIGLANNRQASYCPSLVKSKPKLHGTVLKEKPGHRRRDVTIGMEKHPTPKATGTSQQGHNRR
jgi:hypothetical protein